MAVPLDRVTIDGDVYDVLEDCDQLSVGLGRLRRHGLLSDQDWSSSIEQLAKICATLAAHLSAQ